MITQVSGQKASVIFDEDFESFRKIMKDEANETLKKTSEQVKTLIKEQTDLSATIATPILTSPAKLAIRTILPMPIAISVSTSVDVCTLNISKKTSHYTVDKYVDSSANKVVDKVIDYSVDSSKSAVDSTQSYVSNIYNYMFSKSDSIKK